MANRVLLVGHGKQYLTKATRQLSQGVTVDFAVPAGWQSSGGVSCGLLSGELEDFSESITGPVGYHEHYLCADEPNTHARKLKAFHDGVKSGANDRNSWIACPRGRSDIALSAIVKRLLAVLWPPLEIVWTCCRSPIGQVAIGKVEFTKPDTLEFKHKSSGNVVKLPTSKPGGSFNNAFQHKVYNTCADGILTVFNSVDIQRVSVWGSSKVCGSTYSSAAAIFGCPTTDKQGDTSLAF